MYEDLKFSEAELALLTQLLERERSELPVEIHHTRSSSVRSELHDRATIVRELLVRLHNATAFVG